jgi:hypothetical protein
MKALRAICASPKGFHDLRQDFAKHPADISPLKTLSRLAIGDAYTSGWNVMLFAAFLAGLYLILWKVSRRLVV